MDKDLELAVSNPTEYLLKPQTKTNWDMSIEDASRAVSYNPAEVLLTKAEREPKSYGWVKTVLTNLGRGAESLFNAETGEQALTEIYTSPHMPKEQADRLIEDMAYARYAGRMSERAVMPKGEQLAEDKYPVTTTLSQGFGQFFAQTLTGMANPAAAWSSLYSTMQGEMEEGLIGKYVEETGGIEGYADRKRMDDTLTGGYAAINTLIERGLGAERIIERAFHNPTRTGLKNAVEQILDPKRFLAKQALKQAGKQALKTGLSENIEEFTQEYVGAATETAAGYKTLAELFSDEQLQKAMIAGAYGQIIGMAGGFGLHTANRIAIKKRVNEWAKEKGIQLSDNQLTQIANELIDSTQEQLVDHVTTTAEIQNHYGQAYNLVKQRITEQIDATGTTPWTDQNKSKDEYIQTLADSITIPAINVANTLNIPLSEFLEIADINTATIAGNIAWLRPITSVEDIDKIIADQDAVIKQEREAKKLGVDDETKLKRARTRKAIAERVRKQIIGEQTLRTIRQNRKKENADYVTAKDLQPEQINTLENAVQATGDQEYVLFGGIRIPVEYQVVELATIQPSHIDGTPNPAYSNVELQNRASRGTTQDVADLREKATNITPERLMRASTSAEGAPVVNEKGEVIAGNGREEIIRYAYENPETAEKYKQELVKQGFNIEGIQQPILVRRNTTMTDQEQIAAADISNISETSAFDNASQARRDTQYLKDSKTPIEFASKLPMSERRGLMQNNGKWNKRKVQQRYEDALLAWLCGNDTQLFENLVLDRGLSQKVIDILATNGTLIYETATKYPDTELREDIYHALVKMQRATRDNFLETTQQLELDGHDVMPENIIIWNWLFTDTTTNRQFLQSYATTLANNHESVNTGEDMFGQKVAPLSKKDALIQALKKADQAKAETMAARGRDYVPLFDEKGMVTDVNLAAAIASYNNQFAPQTEQQQLFQLAYISGTTYYEKPSTKYVLRGGEGQIVHGWGIYALADKEKNKYRYRERQFSGKYVFVPNMPKYQQIIKGAKNQKESQIFKMVLDTIAGRTPINMYKQIGFAGGISAYIPIFYLDALYEVMGNNANKADKQFLEQVITKGQFADESVFKVDPKMSKWLQRAILQTLDMHNDLKNSKFYQKDLPYIFVNTLTLNEVQQDFLDFIKKEFKHKDLNARANKALSEAIITYVQDGGRIEYEPFDNAIFQEAGAQVIDYKEMESGTQVIIEKLRDTLYGGYREMASIDDLIKRFPEQYSGYLGLAAIISKVPFIGPTDLIFRMNNGKTTLANIDQDPDFTHMKDEVEKPGVKLINPAYRFLVSIVNSAKKTFDSKKFKTENSDLPEDAQTWLALSQAMRNMNQKETDALGLFLFTAYAIPESKLDLFIQILQHPENIKITRGQQLEVDVPEDDVLLNEDKTLSKQPSADKIRKILVDFLPGGLGFDFINRAKNHNFDKFKKENNIPEKNLTAYYERILDEVMQQPDNTQIIEPLTNYLMDNLTGDNFYIALGEAIQDTYIELESGEEIGEAKDYDEGPSKTVMGIPFPIELARDVALYLNEQGIKGIKYRGGIDEDGFVIFSDEAVQTLRRLDDDLPMYYQKRGVIRGQYDPELQAILLTKYWNETTLVHEYHHRFLEKLWGYFKQAQTGERAVSDEFLADMDKLFQMLEIDPAQDKLTVVQQEKFATMVEAYLTGLGVDNPENLAFQSFLHWIPEQYKSIMDLGYLDENNEIQNPILDQESIDWFNKWFACPFAPSLPSAPDAQRIINPTDKTGQIVPSSQKIMNNREKEWGQDSEEQNKADAQLWRAINENTPNDMRAALDGEKVNMKAVTNNLPDDTKLPEPHKPTLRDKWFKTYQPDARERAADMAREYLAQNPEHAKELAFADPETMAEFDAPVDHGMLIRAVMETVPHGSDEWYILNDNLATVKSMSGSTLSLSGDLSHQAYLDAKREVEAARELKAAVNYAGTRRGAMDKWNSDIRAFIAQRTEALLATEPDSEERKTAIKAFLEEAKTKFSANTTDSVLNQMDLTGIKTKNSQVFIKWAEKQIKQAAHAKIDANEQKELIKASIAAQLAMKEIDSTVQKDGKYTRAVQSAKDIRHWQFVKDKMKKAYIGRWGKFGIFWDNLFGSYAPSAMLMSVNTLFFANVPSTALNTGTIRLAAKTIGKNNVDETTQKGEIERIKQIFNASGVNLAQMEKPTSPSTLHGEKYTKSEQSHWYDFTFEILGRTDNIFRIPTFVDALARIATKNAGGDKTKATVLFKEYAKLNNQSDEAKIARKQALAVANMAVFTQDGTLATGLNQIRTVLNTISRVPLGLEPQGFGLGNILAPFLKTGANITEMGFDAMLAPIRTVAIGLQKLQGKEIPDIKKLAITSDWINLAWTSVMIALMAAISSDDDEWYTEPYTSGRRYDPDKPYDSIKIGGVWVKMDIFGPVAIPLRTAAMTIKDWEDKKLASIADGMYEALSDTPLVQQFTDSSLDYMSKQPEKYWSSFGYNQANKLVPAQVKSLTKATSRATGATLETDWLGKTIDRKFHRNYGLDGERLTTNDLINILTNRLKYTEQ